MAIPSEEQTLEALEKEPKVEIKIKPETNNPNYKTERVIVNGVTYQIEVGKNVAVPKTIADVLERKGLI